MDQQYSEKLLRTTGAAAAKDARAPQTVLHAAFDAIVRGDFEAFAGFVTDDVELNVTGFGPMDGAWRGRADVVAATRKNFAMLGEQKPEILGMISEGDRTAVWLRENGVFKETGQAYSVSGVQWFTFDQGKIKRIDEIIASTR